MAKVSVSSAALELVVLEPRLRRWSCCRPVNPASSASVLRASPPAAMMKKIPTLTANRRPADNGEVNRRQDLHFCKARTTPMEKPCPVSIVMRALRALPRFENRTHDEKVTDHRRRDEREAHSCTGEANKPPVACAIAEQPTGQRPA